jgi:hypothetical protein
MSALALRGYSALTLGCWLVSACLGQSLWLHVEIEHRGHEHARMEGPALLGLIADHHGDHEHQLSATRGPGLLSPRPQIAAPVLVFVPFAELSPSCQPIHDTASIPRTRASPRRHTILQI